MYRFCWQSFTSFINIMMKTSYIDRVIIEKSFSIDLYFYKYNTLLNSLNTWIKYCIELLLNFKDLLIHRLRMERHFLLRLEWFNSLQLINYPSLIKMILINCNTKKDWEEILKLDICMDMFLKIWNYLISLARNKLERENLLRTFLTLWKKKKKKEILKL